MLIFISVQLGVAQKRKTSELDSLKKQVLELSKQVKQLTKQKAEDDLNQLLQEANQVASKPAESKNELKEFRSGQRSLQAINPEISVTGDAFLQEVVNKNGFSERQRSGTYFRVLGIHFQSNLDPFSLAKVALEVTPEGIELGEAYATWTDVVKNFSLTAGKFRQQFGVINRWHAHSLDQFDFPLALTTILGEEGLNQIGFSIDWLMPPLLATTNTLTIQITNGQNAHLFNNKAFGFPVVLGHLKNFYDINPNTYIELGITAMAGYNNFRGYNENGILIKEPDRLTKLGGIDLTYFWEPVNRAHYHSFVWRSELYYADKEEPLHQHIKAMGGYSYIEYKLNERWQAGFRYDVTQPFIFENRHQTIYQLVPYLTWWQSHWVRFRLQYNYKNGNTFTAADRLLRLQLTWAMGPHKHERY